MSLLVPQPPKKPMFQFDIISLIMLFYAVISLGFLYITNIDPTLRDGVFKYLVIAGASAVFLPLFAGKGWNNLGPPVRTYQWGTLIKKQSLPPVGIAVLGLVIGFFSIQLIFYFFTYGGFLPIPFLSTIPWPNFTPQIFYASGAIVEEFYFRLFPYKALERVAPGAFTNLYVYFLVVAPAGAFLFTAYHILVYQNSNLALSI